MQTKLIQWRKAEKAELKVTVAGDFCPRENNSDDVAARSEEICREIKPYFTESDLRLLQWECTITRQDTPIVKSGPNHRCYPEAVSFAETLDIDAALLANNHTGDYGDPGVKDTLDTLAAHGISTVGAGMNQKEAEAPLIFTRNGLRIGLLNFAEHEFGMAAEDRAGSAGLDVPELPEQIQALKENSDVVLVILHGGHEMYSFPSPRMQKLCRFIARSGADAVFNCHTHCPGGYEIYHNVPIVYSPGNFYFPPRPTSLPCWYIGYVPKFYFDRNGAFAMELLGYYNYQKQLQPMSGEDADNFFSYLDELNVPLENPALLQSYFNSWCMISGLNGYLKIFQNVPAWEFDGQEKIAAWMNLRNVFSCESHNDLLRNTLSMIEFGKLKDAEKYIPMIEQLQKPEWVRTNQ